MKKLAVLLLTASLFFNWCGYRLLTGYWERQADLRLAARLDHDDFDESALVSFKFPITKLSYYNASAAFERISGELNIGEVDYIFVKSRIFNDTMEILCLRNTEKMTLHKASNELYGKVNNLPHSKPLPQKDVQKLYSPANLEFTVTRPDLTGKLLTGYLTCLLPAGYLHRAERPPANA